MSQILRNGVVRAAGGLRHAPLVNVTQRSIANSGAMRCKPKEEVGPAKPNPLADGASLRSAYRPNRFEQRMLVWTKKYPSLSEVPTHVSPETMEYCRNKMRIRIANYMAVATVVGCILMIWSGKRAAKRGENMANKNLDWHNQYNTRNADEEPKKP